MMDFLNFPAQAGLWDDIGIFGRFQTGRFRVRLIPILLPSITCAKNGQYGL